MTLRSRRYTIRFFLGVQWREGEDMGAAIGVVMESCFAHHMRLVPTWHIRIHQLIWKLVSSSRNNNNVE